MNLNLESIRNRLCKLSGEDFTIISRCNEKIQFYFSAIGFLVLLILLCSLVSALYFTDHLFNSIIADVGVGLVWGFIVTNMYVLLLYTISPVLLPIRIRKKQETKTAKFQFSFSLSLRIFIVTLLAIIIAQPLNVLLFIPQTTTFAFDVKQLLATNPLAIVNTLFVVGIFLLPIYLKYSIRRLGEFYEFKADIEKSIIQEDYKKFKVVYSQLIERKIVECNQSVWGNLTAHLSNLEKNNLVSYQKHFVEISNELIPEKVDKYEYWADPPFRTVLKSKSKRIYSEKEFLSHIYSEPD
jgi:hypothetical protein